MPCCRGRRASRACCSSRPGCRSTSSRQRWSMVAIYLIAQLAHRRNALTVVTWGWWWPRASRARPGSAASRFAASALVAAPLLLSATERSERWRFLGALVVAAIDCGGGRRAVPARPDRRGGRAQQRFADRGDAARGIRRRHSRLAAPLLDLPGFWLVFLPVELTAIYIPGVIALVAFLTGRDLDPIGGAWCSRSRRWSLQASRSRGSWRARSPTTTISAGGRCCPRRWRSRCSPPPGSRDGSRRGPGRRSP